MSHNFKVGDVVQIKRTHKNASAGRAAEAHNGDVCVVSKIITSWPAAEVHTFTGRWLIIQTAHLKKIGRNNG